MPQNTICFDLLFLSFFQFIFWGGGWGGGGVLLILETAILKRHKGKGKQNLNMAVNGGRSDIVRIDIERLVSSTKDASMSPKCCIFKTPVILRRINEQAYVPDAFSIGPFHHGDRKLRDTKY